MQMMAPSGSVYQAGTLSGNPLAMTAGIETLKALNRLGMYDSLEKRAMELERGIYESAAKRALKVNVSRYSSLLTVFFNDLPVTDFNSAKQSNLSLFAGFFQQLLEQGVYWPPSQFEAAFISLVHSDNDVKTTIKAINNAFVSLNAD